MTLAGKPGVDRCYFSRPILMFSAESIDEPPFRLPCRFQLIACFVPEMVIVFIWA